ncbi:hypothetical protein AMECASPLE_003413 [Ameca splendens]|uniref:Uncharacterized protein n=1 Tax=Ameca splendens TaxID=208324 RepID=A0ABV0ZIT4_9TELE
MEDSPSPPLLHLVIPPQRSNQRRVCSSPRPITSQDIIFKDLQHGRHCSLLSFDLPPPLSPPSGSHIPYKLLQATPPPGSDSRGEDVPNPNPKMAFLAHVILRLHVFLQDPSAK